MISKNKNFALIGAAGYIAPRHMRAIKENGGNLIAAMDPHDSVGIIDSYFPKASFFTEIERLDRHLEKLRRNSENERVNYISICSPNYLHDAHVRLALRLRATAICEKPLVSNPWNLDALEELENEYGTSVHTILQLRLHPAILALKQQLDASPRRERDDVVLTYITKRGKWYGVSWKGDENKSGGLVVNIGVHFFDILIWMFGKVKSITVHTSEPQRWSGVLELEHARVRCLLSVDEEDLPAHIREAGGTAYRSLTINSGEAIDFTTGFTDLHTRSYAEILAGRGFTIEDARPSIQLTYDIRQTAPDKNKDNKHPLLENR